MKKTLIFLIALMFIISLLPAKADTVILKNGEVVNGKVFSVLDGFIIVNTKDGQKAIAREISHNQARDIVVLGFRNKSKITGHIYYVDKQSLNIKTTSGDQKINRIKVRDIVLSSL